MRFKGISEGIAMRFFHLKVKAPCEPRALGIGRVRSKLAIASSER